MVKRSRDQSTEAPSRRVCFAMMPPVDHDGVEVVVESGQDLVAPHSGVGDRVPRRRLGRRRRRRRRHAEAGGLRGIPVLDEYIIEAGFRFTAIECDERMVKTIKVQPETH